jgi:hypothetical protein
MTNSSWTSANPWLLGAAVLSVLGALLHIACIFGGPDWYRAFGAGEPIARAAERGSPVPALRTLGISLVLFSWAAFALSAAGLLPRLPLLPWALIAITAVLTARGVLIFVPDWWRPDLSAGFKFGSSLFVLAMAVCFAIGTAQRWPHLGSTAAALDLTKHDD